VEFGSDYTSSGNLLKYFLQKPSVILTHSQAGPFGWSIGDARPNLTRGIIAIEPTGPPFLEAVFAPIVFDRRFGITDIPIAYSPPISDPSELMPTTIFSDPSTNYTCMQQGANPPHKLTNLADIPVLVVTSQSSYHAIFDSCTVNYLRQAGVQVQHAHLPDFGLMGNGHMMFMEMNNIDIATKVLEPWLNSLSLNSGSS
jgi:hypothetical protein